MVLLYAIHCFSQQSIEGVIQIGEKQKTTVDGASVYWLNHKNIGATSNQKGYFKIPYKKEYQQLIVSYIGYKTDTLIIKNAKFINHTLIQETILDEVAITTERQTTRKSFLEPQNILTIDSGELLKAACCNLSESFETNPSIDVHFSDALTGTKQIQMLGLKSPYLLITEENIPAIRGASQVFGLTFIPGTWISSIQITKGAGSVVNGFESISGQINTELVKPFSDNKLLVNAYGSLGGRLEVNTHWNQKINKKWHTGIYVHGNYRGIKFDENNDGFLDNPLAKQINLMNRWQYTDTEKGWLSFINFKYLNDRKQLGQIDFDTELDRNTLNAWGSEIHTERFDISTKLGYVFPDLPFQNFGFQMAYSNHNQDAYFGLRDYNIKQESFYSNFLFHSIIGDTRHTFKTGINFMYDTYDELVASTIYQRKENAIGGFFEYAFSNADNFSFTSGIRFDIHNLLGTFITPRLHARYTPWQKGVFKASVGRGKRSANIFAENQQLFASSRAINVQNTGGKIYGLDPEIAWNYGVSFLQGYKLFQKKGDIGIDLYQTKFENKVVVDWENPQEIAFYNVVGKSTARSFQIEVNQNIIPHFNIRLAYKVQDVKTAYQEGELQQPLQAKNRFFASTSYETHKEKNGGQWKFDMTYNWVGKQRLPNTESNPTPYQLRKHSKSYHLLNTQITKVFSSQFEMYAGAENITNYTQKNPILGSDDPFGAYFDTTIVYAPVFGSNYYIGLRYKIK